MKVAYKLWHLYLHTIPKIHRYTLGGEIDKQYIQITENILIASFLHKQDKQPFIKKAIISLDVLKFLLLTLWELNGVDNKKYIAISEILSEAGKQLGGWHGQILKQNSPAKAREK